MKSYLGWMLILLPALLRGGELDLPVPPVRLGDKKPHAPAEDDDPTADPRDTPAPTFYGEEIDCEGDSIYYVIDMSGSMQNCGAGTPGNLMRSFVAPDGSIQLGNRWERAKAEAIRSIRGLADNFKFGIVLYNCSTEAWSSELRDATATNKADAEGWLRRHYWADGMTATGPGTAIGLRAGTGAVVLLTDGEPNCGADGLEGHRRMISSNNVRHVPITVFGIDAQGDWRRFCQNVANDSGGKYYDVP
ncbi:MAG: hypothetical protein AB7L09_00710 [Nitrospira sp.]